MSPDPNQPSQSSKSASPSPSEAKTQTNAAPEPSSSAESMTDQPANSMLVTPPTRMTPSDDAASKQDTPTTAGSVSDAQSSSPTPEVKGDPAKDQVNSSSTAHAPEPSPAAEAASSVSNVSSQSAPGPRHQPIPPASEPMQYRAIGLVRGKYTPSEEQFTRGFILTDDEVLIDAVLLGRVMSLVKKHINLEESHLWVVYPRTREKDLELHMQIVGVWEPDKLNRPASLHMDDSAEPEADLEDDEADEDSDEEALEVTTDEMTVDEETDKAAADQVTIDEPTETEVAETSAPEAALTDDTTDTTDATDETVPGEDAASGSDVALPSPDDLNDRYFSVRGEVVYQSEEEQRLLVKIRRSPKQGSTQAKAFKVALKGVLQGKALGYFWDLQVQRENNELVITEATQIGMVPPQKRRGGSGDRPPRRGGGGPRRGGQSSGPPRKRWQNNREGGRPSRGDRPMDRPIGSDRASAPPTPRPPISKPIKRRPKNEES